jgi:Cdc6-like AAA superfamily ATPase
MLDADRIGSMIFYGPPGTGKTTLAELIAKQTRRHFERLNATTSGVRLPSGSGGCLPPYFLFQLRVDGHPI